MKSKVHTVELEVVLGPDDVTKLAASTLRIADLTNKLRREGLRQVRIMKRLELRASTVSASEPSRDD